MKANTVKFSEIAKHPTLRMDASYHIGKQNGNKAYKKGDNGLLVEDDVNGAIMLTEAEAKIYNELKVQSNTIAKKLKSFDI